MTNQKPRAVCLAVSFLICSPATGVADDDTPAVVKTELRAQADPLYPMNAPPLRKNEYQRLPLGAVRPAGWIKDQLLTQKNGLTGHLDEFWLANSAWKGGDSEKLHDQLKGGSWGRAGKFIPEYLAGLMPLAYLLDHPGLKSKVEPYLEWILASGQPDGWFGLDRDFPGWNRNSMLEFNSLVLLMLIEYHDVSQDPRIVPLMSNYFRYISENYRSFPQQTQWGIRVGEHMVSALWLYNRTQDPSLLKFVDDLHDKSFNWGLFFVNFPWTDPRTTPVNFGWDGQASHVYNIARAIKHPPLWYVRSEDPFYKDALYAGLRNLDRFHGQLGGRFSGDEFLAGTSPAQGTELCAISLFMYSLEKSIEILGDPALADRLEMLAFNCLPATITPDFWAHQYDQQTNQVLVSLDERDWKFNGPSANIYGLMPNFPCCAFGMHQAWPRFVQHMWMATPDRGLAAMAYGPCRVTAKVGTGATVTIEETTDYPFDGEIAFRISTATPLTFPLRFRVPAWSSDARLTYGGETHTVPGGRMANIEREWRDGDVVTLKIPMRVATETRYNNAISIRRGPLYFALRIGKKYERISLNDMPNVMSIPYMGSVDWEIRPLTPWNYGLIIDGNLPESSFTVRRNPITEYPFADAGDPIYDQAMNAYQDWQKDAPLVMDVQGKRIPQWTLKRNSADVPPKARCDPMRRSNR